MTIRPAVELVGTGRYTPEKVLTNADFERMVDTSDQWIRERTGIRERCIADDSETVAQNVGFPLLLHTRLPRTKIAQLVRDKLEWVGLGDSGPRLPGELSGGQKKRIALARAIALSPEVGFAGAE